MATKKQFKVKVEKLGYEIPTDATSAEANAIQRHLGEIIRIIERGY